MTEDLLMSHADWEDHRDDAFEFLEGNYISRDVRHDEIAFNDAVEQLADDMQINDQDAFDYVIAWLDDVGWED